MGCLKWRRLGADWAAPDAAAEWVCSLAGLDCDAEQEAFDQDVTMYACVASPDGACLFVRTQQGQFVK